MPRGSGSGSLGCFLLLKYRKEIGKTRQIEPDVKKTCLISLSYSNIQLDESILDE